MTNFTALSSFAILAATSFSVQAQVDYLWTGGAFTEDWNDENNWQNLSMGNTINGFPSLLDSARFSSSASVFGGEALSVWVDSPATVIFGNIGSTSSTQIDGTITNNSTISFAQDSMSSFGDINQRLYIPPLLEGVVFTGDGRLVMNGLGTGIQGIRQPAEVLSTLTNSVNHLITGSGRIADLKLINEGVVRPTFGEISIVRSEIRGGTIDIPDEGALAVDLGANINSTIIMGSPGSGIRSSTGSGILQNLTLEGSLMYGKVNGTASSTEIGGTITNNSVITFIQDSNANINTAIDQRFVVVESQAGTVLAGDGRIIFNGSETGIQGNGASSSKLTNGPDHLITGAGSIADLRLINTGIIRPTFGEMSIARSVVQGGIIDITEEGIFSVDTGADIHSSVVNGVAGVPGSRIRSAPGPGGTLRDLTLEGNLTFGNLNGNRSSTAMAGTVINNSTITFAQDSSLSLDQNIFIPIGQIGTTLTGSGQIILNGLGTGIEGASTNSATSNLIHGQNHLITGTGSIAKVRIVNNGLIQPTLGGISVTGAEITGGVIDMADKGALIVNTGADINNTVVTGVAGSNFRGSSTQSRLQDLTIQGSLACGNTSGTSTVGIAGTIANNGVVTFISDSANSFGDINQRLFVPTGLSGTDLVGNGQIVFNGSGTGIQGDRQSPQAPSRLVNGTDHLITGSGRIADVRLVNEGVIRPTLGDVSILRAEVRGGMIDISEQGGLAIDVNANINSCIISGVSGAQIKSVTGTGTLQDLTLDGALMYGKPNGTASSTEIAGTITNNSVLTFIQDSNANINTAIDQRLFVPADQAGTTLAGDGKIVFNGSQTGIQGEGAVVSRLTNGPEHTISGYGIISDIRITNEGTIDPSGGNRVIHISDNSNIELTSTSKIAIDIDGVMNGQFDSINMSSEDLEFSIDGSIQIRLDDGYIASLGESWTIIEGGMISGSFSNEIFPPTLSGLAYRVLYDSDMVVVKLTCIADLNGDSNLDFFDVSAFLDAFGNQEPPADFTNDGEYDFFDVSAFLDAFGAGCM